MGWWFLAGDRPEDYAVDAEKERWRGLRVATLRCSVEQPLGFGTLMRNLSPAPVRPAFRLSAWLRPVEVGGWAGLWVRVDGPEDPAGHPNVLAFDNMYDRALRGTADWQRYDVVLGASPEAVRVAYGVLLTGSGAVSVCGVRLERSDEEPSGGGDRPPEARPTEDGAALPGG